MGQIVRSRGRRAITPIGEAHRRQIALAERDERLRPGALDTFKSTLMEYDRWKSELSARPSDDRNRPVLHELRHWLGQITRDISRCARAAEAT